MEKILSDYLKKIGKRGGETTKKRYGRSHFTELNRIRWAAKKRRAQ